MYAAGAKTNYETLKQARRDIAVGRYLKHMLTAHGFNAAQERPAVCSKVHI